MGIKQLFDKLSTPDSERDRRKLAEAIAALEVVPIRSLTLRAQQRTAGEIESVRVVPRAHADAVEATITDGDGRLTAVFLGRRSIPGISPGRRIIVEGVPAQSGNRILVFNPRYTLLTAR